MIATLAALVGLATGVWLTVTASVPAEHHAHPTATEILAAVPAGADVSVAEMVLAAVVGGAVPTA